MPDLADLPTVRRPRRDVLIPAALAYAARGWHVFPLRPGDKRPAFPDHPETACRPGSGRDPRCRRAGRHVTWEERATTDAARIRTAWQTLTPAGPYGIGIACGPSRLLVLDLDTPKPDPHGVIPDPPAAWALPGVIDGADVLSVVCERAGQPYPLGSTWTVRTGSGGLHLYFTTPPGTSPAGSGELRSTAGHLGWLIDTRGAGGYVVAPPTVVTTNRGAGRYAVEDEDAPVAPLPAWLTAALTPAPLPAQEPVTAALRPLRDTLRGSGQHGADDRAESRRTAYLASAVARQVEAVTTVPVGGRNRALYQSAVALGQLVAGGELDAEDTTTRLTAAAAYAGLTPAETARTVASGLRAGTRRPRTLTTPSTTTPASSTSATSIGAAA